MEEQHVGGTRFRCPRCGETLQAKPIRGVVCRACPACGGMSLGLEAVRKFSKPPDFAAILNGLQGSRATASVACPACQDPMRQVDVRRPGAMLHLDGCPACRLVWFDAGEARAVAREAPPRPPEGTLPPEALKVWGSFLARKVRRHSRDQMVGADQLDDAQERIGGLFGLPVIDQARQPGTVRIVYLVGIAMVVAAVVGLFRGESRTLLDYGFQPSAPLRHMGATVLTSLLLHINPQHFLGNACALLLLGSALEQTLGGWRVLLVLLAGEVLGDVLAVLVLGGSDRVLVGASGGISGLLALSMVSFPKARLRLSPWSGGGILPTPRLLGGTLPVIRFPAWAFGAGWMALQVWLLFGESSGRSSVSALSHLAGVSAGLALAVCWKPLLKVAAFDELDDE